MRRVSPQAHRRVRAMSDNQKLLISVLGAVVGHLLLFVLLAILFTVAPTRSEAATSAAKPPEEITVMLSELMEQVELTPKDLTQRYMRTDPDQESAVAPENAPFHSDRDTLATSERPPDPSTMTPGPTVTGRDDLPFIEIRDREFVDGDFLETSAASAPSTASTASPAINAMPAMAQTQVAAAKPTPLRDPSEQPAEVEKKSPADPADQPREALDTKPKTPADADTPPDFTAELVSEPEAPPVVTDTPMLAQRAESFDTPFAADPALKLEEIAEQDREAKARKRADETGEPAAPETPEAASAMPLAKPLQPAPRETAATASPSTPSPPQTASPDIPPTPKPPSDTPAFNSHTRARSMEGNTAKVGNTPSFDVEASALGRYKKRVTQAVERQWHRYRQQNASFVTYGTLKVKFRVDKLGVPRNLKLVKNDSNAVMAEFTLRAVLDANIPAMPEEVAAMLGSSGLEISYDVIVY